MAGLEFTKNQKLALVAIIGLIVIAVSIKLARNSGSPTYGGVVFNEAGQSADGVNITTSDSDPASSSDQNSGKVIFQVSGCVKSPNVYALPRGSRIVDAVRIAGGPKPGADLQSLNLAAKIEDGSRIFVPSSQPNAANAAASVVAQPASLSANSPPAPSSKASDSRKLSKPGEGLVHINSADANELQRLPGVGPSTAQKIIEYRTQIGKFARPEQLDDVKGIGPKKLEKMRPFVAL